MNIVQKVVESNEEEGREGSELGTRESEKE